MLLYHFSENPNIDVFKPRLSKSHPHLKPVIWAINEKNSLHYYLPRDCPRVIYWKSERTNKKDLKQFFGSSAVDKIIVVENQWLDRIRNVELYKYTFDEKTFELFNEAETAGYYISYKEVVPVKVEQIKDIIGELLISNIELRFTPDLHPIRNRVISSTVDFSIIRFRNAKKHIGKRTVIS